MKKKTNQNLPTKRSATPGQSSSDLDQIGKTVDQIATEYKIPVSEIARAIHDGSLAVIKSGANSPALVSLEELESWAAEHQPAKIHASLTGVPEHDSDDRLALLAHLPYLARRMVDADYAALTLVSPIGRITRMFVSGMSDKQAAAMGHPPIGKGLLGSLDSAGAPVRVNDIESHPRSSGFPGNHPEMQSMIGVGIDTPSTDDASNDRARLYLTRGAGQPPFTPEDQELLESIAIFAAQALELEILKRGESELRVRAEEAEQAKTEFISMINHDLKNPIAAMRLALQSAVQKPGEFDEHLMTDLSTSLDEQSALVNSLLDMAQLGRTRPELDIEEVFPVEILTEAAARMRRTIRGENRTIEVDAEHNLPPIMCDSRQIGRVMDNLLSNALKYSEGPVKLSAIHDPDLQCTTMSVTDTGNGISAADIERLFEPFERLHRADRPIEGLGLGLAICKKIVEAHGASIAYAKIGAPPGSRRAATEKTGSEFSVTFALNH